MIDFEKEIFNNIAQVVRNVHSDTGVMVYSSYPKSLDKFPIVTIELAHNNTYKKSLTNTNLENHAVYMFDVNVYSNLTVGAKTQVKAILDTVDTTFQHFGFRRVSSQALPNTEDATIYRMIARYDGIISKTGQVYRA